MSFVKVMYGIPSLPRWLSFSNHEGIWAFVKSFSRVCQDGHMALSFILLLSHDTLTNFHMLWLVENSFLRVARVGSLVSSREYLHLYLEGILVYSILVLWFVCFRC